MILYLWSKLIKKIRGKAIKNSNIHPSSKIEAGSTVYNSTFNKYSFCGYNCKILNADIGAFCSIADGVIIGPAEHPIDWASTSPVFYKGRDSVKMKFSSFNVNQNKRTIIGNDVWIGENAMIKSGISIGTGAVIAMGAIVTHDVMPYEVVGGVPSSHIKYRFDEDTIKLLLKSKWWELNNDVLKQVASLIKTPDEFAEKILNMNESDEKA